MNIGLLAVDSNYPNLALMKISAWHKARGDNVGWYNPFNRYDKVYMAKVFSFTEDYEIDDNGEVVPSLRQLDYNGGMSAIPLYVNFKKTIIELV